MNIQQFSFFNRRIPPPIGIAIVVIVFLILGGILGYHYWRLPKQEIPIIQIPKIEKPEEIGEITKPPTIAGILNDPRLEETEEVYVAENYAYVKSKRESIIIDVSDPKDPRIINPEMVKLAIIFLKSKDENCSIVGKYAYCMPGKSTVLFEIIDISKFPQLPVVGSISKLELPQKPGEPLGLHKYITEFKDFYVGDKYAYLIEEKGNTFITLDVSDPKTPTVIKWIFLNDVLPLKADFRVKKIYVFNNRAYIVAKADSRAFIIVVDISDKRNPKIVGSINEKRLAELIDFAITETHIYKITKDTLSIIDISTSSFTIISSITFPKAKLSKIYVSGKYAYLFENSGFYIVDVSKPEAPVVKFSIFDLKLEGIKNVFIKGRYIYLVASRANNFVIIDLKGKITFTPKPIPILSKEVLEFEEKFIEKDEREIAFLHDGDIWVLSKDLKKKYKLIDSKEAIIDFDISPNGKEIYWLNEKGELWKENEKEEIQPLISIEKDMKKEFQEIPKEFEKKSFYYYKGKVENFWLSPDGNYLAYERLEGYTGCCTGPPTIPVTWIWIMKNDGSQKIPIEKPAGVRRPLIFFDGWLPDSRRILFHFSAPDEVTQGSPFYEVGITGKNPKLYTEIFKIIGREGKEIDLEKLTPEEIGELTTKPIGTEPVYSPSGEKVAYIKEGNQVRLKDIKTNETKTILELKEDNYFPFGPASEVLKWSDDGSLLLVKTNNKIFVLDKAGKIVFEEDFQGAEEIGDIILSTDNKYLAGVYRLKGERIEIFFFIDLVTKERKEFKLPEFKEIRERISIDPQFFTDGKRFYYSINVESEEPEVKQLFPQLWMIDINTWKNYKIADKVLKAVRIP
jgi:hypothetical protein